MSARLRIGPLLGALFFCACVEPTAAPDLGSLDATADGGLDAAVDVGLDLGADAGLADLGDPLLFEGCPWPVQAAVTETSTFAQGRLQRSRISETACGDTPGAEAIFLLSLTAPQRVYLEVSSSVDTTLSVRSDCEDLTTELGCSDDRAFDDVTPALLLDLPAGAHFIVVDSLGNVEAEVALQITTSQAPLNSLCQGAQVLENGEARSDVSLAGALPVAIPVAISAACGDAASEGPAHFYETTLPPDHRLVAELSGDAQLRFFDDCTLRCAPSGALVSPRLEPRRVVFAVVGRSEASRYDLRVSHVPLASNARCEAAPPLPSSAVLTLSIETGAPSDACGGASATLFYRVDLQPGDILNAELTSAQPPDARPRLALVQDCTANTCLAGSANTPERPGLEHLRYVHEEAATSLLLMLSGPEGLTGPFELSLEISQPSADSVCEAANELTPGAPQLIDTRWGQTATTACGALDAAVFRSLTLAPGELLTVTTSAAEPPAVHVVDACDSQVCLHSNADTQTTLSNPGAFDRTFLLAIGPQRSAPTEPVMLSVAPRIAAPHATCEAAMPVTHGLHLPSEDALDGLAFETTDRTFVSALHYRAEVPAGFTLGVSTRRRRAPVSISLLDSCTGNVLAKDPDIQAPLSTSPHIAWRAAYSNETSASQSVSIVAGYEPQQAGAPFELEFWLQPTLVAGADCETALPLYDGFEQRFVRTSSSATSSFSSYYTAQLPPGQSLITRTFGASDTFTFSPCKVIQLDSSAGQFTEHFNDTAATQTVAVRPDSDFHDFAVSIGEPSYVRAEIPTACDVLSPADAIPYETPGMYAGADRSLPFVFPSFQQPQTGYRVLLDGYLVFTPAPYNRSGQRNLRIRPYRPGPTTPPPAIAPYWDEQLLPTDPASAVRAATFGSAPNRRQVIEWNNLTFANDPAARLRFQAKLFENGVLEFHYCELTAGIDADLSTGGSASVGLLSPDAELAWGLGHNRAGLVSTQTAFRFVPGQISISLQLPEF